MELVIKYKVEKPFTDKYSKEEVKQNDIIEVTVERMKELNAKSVGRVVDILVVEEEKEPEKLQEDIENNNLKPKFVREELEAMTVNQLKDLAQKNNIELKEAKKQDIIDELINN